MLLILQIGNDSMHKRVSAMLRFMNIREIDQPNKGRINIDRDAFIKEVEKNGGRIVFDAQGYQRFKDEETSSNKVPITEQCVRPQNGAPRTDDFYVIPHQENVQTNEMEESIGNQRSQDNHVSTFRSSISGGRTERNNNNDALTNPKNSISYYGPVNDKSTCKGTRDLPTETKDQGRPINEGDYRSKLDQKEKDDLELTHFDKHRKGDYQNSMSYYGPVNDKSSCNGTRDIPMEKRNQGRTSNEGNHRNKLDLKGKGGLELSHFDKHHTDDYHHRRSCKDEEKNPRTTSFMSGRISSGDGEYRIGTKKSINFTQPRSREPSHTIHRRDSDRTSYSVSRNESGYKYSSHRDRVSYDSPRNNRRSKENDDMRSSKYRKRSPSQDDRNNYQSKKRVRHDSDSTDERYHRKARSRR